MLRIRLRRVGAKHNPKYRVVVADSRSPRDGAFVEIIGHYDPIPDPPKIVIDEEKALKWLRQGAQPSDTVAKFLKRMGTLERVKER
ncbi:MAG: 30S ribosomal protein S16 [Chloroflexi bacterium]|jgi:small subunit ribosomal protein S16|nr:30S ribosomal protein S16 [Chloroflexota bacterium]MCH8086755.1 30S ribosomal protein S16 [Chloroflexota bacterium]MCH8090207.1 30S ribosomal protein S16 [Chloroflexota bacterium]MCH9036358.1 30S ribosomal protein S16 [Chloroflexota bacterium]